MPLIFSIGCILIKLEVKFSRCLPGKVRKVNKYQNKDTNIPDKLSNETVSVYDHLYWANPIYIYSLKMITYNFKVIAYSFKMTNYNLKVKS